MSDINVIDHLTAPERFKTQTRLAEAAGVKQNTISDKRRSNALTHEQMRRILAVAPAMGVDIKPDDFFPELAQQSEAA
jgi:transcriptional regulator with XRE-family HTH domain